MNINDSLDFYHSDNYNNYIDKSKNSLNYKESKIIFGEKILFVEEFKQRLEKENNGEFIRR